MINCLLSKLTTVMILIQMRTDFSLILARNKIIPLMKTVESRKGWKSAHCAISLTIHSNAISADENPAITILKIHSHICGNFHLFILTFHLFKSFVII